jgi:hypothetical protein
VEIVYGHLKELWELFWKTLMTGKKEMYKQKLNVKSYVCLKVVLPAGKHQAIRKYRRVDV